jgi:hypothetical protein
MPNKTRALFVAAGAAVCYTALAVTGNTSIIAGGNSFQYGLTGKADSPTLSDGKNIISLFEQNSSSRLPGIPALHFIELAIGRFSSDPGKGYINHAYISCASAPTTYSSMSAKYAWISVTGNAIWTWELDPTQVCMSFTSGPSYSLSLD